MSGGPPRSRGEGAGWYPEAQWGLGHGRPCLGACSSAGLGAEGVRVDPWSLGKLPAFSPQVVPVRMPRKTYCLCVPLPWEGPAY